MTDEMSRSGAGSGWVAPEGIDEDELPFVEPPDIRQEGRRLPDRYYLSYLVSCCEVLGRAPSRRELRAMTCHEPQTFANRFGNYTRAKKAAEAELRRSSDE